MQSILITYVAPAAISFAIAVIIGPFVISALRKHKAGQTEREELESHQKKMGTPTMGGLIFLPAFVIACLVSSVACPKVLPVMLLTLGFGVVGFLDDFLKVILRRSDGLIAWQKMLLQIVITTGFAAYLHFSGIGFSMLVPFWHGHSIDIGIIAVPLCYIAVIGTVNGSNFTDGLDGLATSVTIVIALFLLLADIYLKGEISPAALAMTGGLCAFLIFNHYPAKIFMGDTGSLALGGFVSGMAYMLHIPLLLPIIALIYVVEVLSVIIQVTYFKRTGGKRIFRMAPIHHHFELGGWSEKKVVVVFTFVTLLMCAIGYLGLVV